MTTGLRLRGMRGRLVGKDFASGTVESAEMTYSPFLSSVEKRGVNNDIDWKRKPSKQQLCLIVLQ